MKWLVALLLFCAIPVQSAPVTLDLDGEPQKQPLWCWVAVSKMAIRSFPEDVGANIANKKFRHFSQEEVYARSFHEVRTVKQEFEPEFHTAEEIRELLETKVENCRNDLETCNERGQPLLFDIDYDVPSRDKALTIKAIKLDIDGKLDGNGQPAGQPPGKGNGHPIVIQWTYRPAGCASDDANEDEMTTGDSFTHALIITGYDIEAQAVRIYDPLPVWSPQNTDKLHERWIPFSAYIDPASHEGLAVVALHAKDQYRMRRKGTNPLAAKKHYKMTAARATCPVQPDPGGFEPDEALQGSIDRYMESRKGWFPDRDGRPRTGRISTGKPVPVVALGVNQLSDGTPLKSMLDRRANAYVVPILENKAVVDSFLLLPKNGGWQQGGYSNNQIAYLLTELGEKHRDKLQPGEVFYLVSIPEMASYFIAHGFKDQAKLLSLNREDSGQFEDAKCAINEAIASFHRTRSASRPRPSKHPATSQ